jgi:hypothetical protein
MHQSFRHNSKASKQHTNKKLRGKFNKSYDKSLKHDHDNLTICAGLLPRARDQPREVTLTNLITKTIHNKPQEDIDILTTHYIKEQQRATSELLPKTPWTQPQNLDNFEIIPLLHHTAPHSK